MSGPVATPVKHNTSVSTEAGFSMSKDDLKALKCDALRTQLAERGLQTTGNKPDLVERLFAALSATEPRSKPKAMPRSTSKPGHGRS
jgi:hypothetical protein